MNSTSVVAESSVNSLHAVCFFPRKIFFKEIDDSKKYVIFCPDRKGFPVVISSSAFLLISCFAGGCPLFEVLVKKHGNEVDLLDFGDKISIINLAMKRGFLRAGDNFSRYNAQPIDSSDLKSISVWLHVNNECNLDCSYCFVKKDKSRMNQEILKKTAHALAETAKNRNLRLITIKFAGGEPTMAIDSMSLFVTAMKMELENTNIKVNYSILSNGTIASKKLIEFIKECQASISISLDGYGEDSHDIYRRYKVSNVGSWEKITKNIEIFKQNGIRPSINATISQESAETLSKLLVWITENKLRAHLSVVRQPNSSWTSGVDRTDEYKKLISVLSQAFERAFSELELDRYEVDPSTAFDICELHFETPTYSACCGIGSNHIVINEQGEIASCPMTVHEKTSSAGSDVIAAAKEVTVDWHPEKRGEDGQFSCRDCLWFPVCTGGCPVTNERITGIPFGISPLHDFYEFIIPRYIEFYGRKIIQSAGKGNIDAHFLI